MYPHERSLVKKLAKEKFVLLGIDSDATPTKVRAAMKRENLTWPMRFGSSSRRRPTASDRATRGRHAAQG